MAAPGECSDGGGLRAAELRARRSLPVRLEPRDRRDQGRDDDREGGAPAALPQPDAVRAGVSAREPGDGVRRPRSGVRLLQGRLHAGDLRQHEDRGGHGLRWQGARLQSPVPADVWALPGGAGRLHPGRRLGEGSGREPGGRRPAAAVHAAPALREPRGAQCLAARPLRRVGQGAAPSRGSRPDDLGDVRGRAGEPGALCRAVRRLPRGARHRLQDLPRPIRQQQILGLGERRRPAGRDPGLRRPHRAAPGRPRRRRAPPRLRPRPDRLRSLALRAGARPQARRAQERRPVQGLAAAGGARAGASQAGQGARR